MGTKIDQNVGKRNWKLLLYCIPYLMFWQSELELLILHSDRVEMHWTAHSSQNYFLSQSRICCHFTLSYESETSCLLQLFYITLGSVVGSFEGEESLTIFLDKQKLSKKSEVNGNSSTVSLEILHQLAASYFTDRESTLRRLHHLQIATSAIKVPENIFIYSVWLISHKYLPLNISLAVCFFLLISPCGIARMSERLCGFFLCMDLCKNIPSVVLDSDLKNDNSGFIYYLSEQFSSS